MTESLAVLLTLFVPFRTTGTPVELLIVPDTGALFTLTLFDVSTVMPLVTPESSLKWVLNCSPAELAS